MAVLSVGADAKYKTIAAAVAASKSGDTIDVEAGTYTNDFITISHDLTLNAEGEVKLVAIAQPPNGKAYIDEGGAGVSVTVNGDFDISGVTVPDGNGAAIRYEGGNLILNGVNIHNNQEGILGAADIAGSIIIENSTFTGNGSGTGFTHNIYIGEIDSLTVEDSTITSSVVGHEIKSRALNNTIIDNTIEDGATGNGSYEIDLPNGGNAVIEGNFIEKGSNASNPIGISFGEEGGVYSSSSLLVSGNTIVNDDHKNSTTAIRNATSITATITDNTFYGWTTLTSGPATLSGNATTTTEPTSAPMLGDGSNTVTWTQGNAPMSIDSGLKITNTAGSTISGATITIASGLLAGDVLGFVNQNGITGTYDASTGVLTLSGMATNAGYQAALDSITFSSTSSTPTNIGADDTRTINFKVTNGSGSSNTVSTTIDLGAILTLTTGTDMFTGGAGNDVFVAGLNTLGRTDSIDGGPGTNTLELTGAGTYNLAYPLALTNIQVVIAQEGQAASPGYNATNQILTLRAGTSMTIEVAADPNHRSGNAKPDTITINGADNNDTINLGPGLDVVTVGGPGETVHGGGGADTIIVNRTTIGATIDGGTGSSVLDVTGGGAATMGTNVTDIATANLMAASTPWWFVTNASPSLLVDDLNLGADTITLQGSDQTITGGGAGALTMVGGLVGDTFRDPGAILNHDVIKNFAAGQTIDITDLNSLAPDLAWTQTTGTYGTLRVTDGTHTAAITLFGVFNQSGFQTVADSGSGTNITYHSAA
jgi:hypothetical protein